MPGGDARAAGAPGHLPQELPAHAACRLLGGLVVPAQPGHLAPVGEAGQPEPVRQSLDEAAVGSGTAAQRMVQMRHGQVEISSGGEPMDEVQQRHGIRAAGNGDE